MPVEITIIEYPLRKTRSMIHHIHFPRDLREANTQNKIRKTVDGICEELELEYPAVVGYPQIGTTKLETA